MTHRMSLMLCTSLLWLSSACATTTNIVSQPPGAKVYDAVGTELGTTPFAYTSESWKTTKDVLELKKPGYVPKKVALERSAINLGPFVGGIVLAACGVPMLSTIIIGGGMIAGGVVLILAGGWNYPEETAVELERGGGGGDVGPAIRPRVVKHATPVAMAY